MCHDTPSVLPPDRGVRHEIDLAPGLNIVSHDSGPCLRSNVISLMASSVLSMRQEWYVRVKSPHSTPTFCIKKPNGKWRIVPAYNKLNAVTIPA